MGPIRTTIVGSLPKPSWLSDPEQLRAPWRQEGDALTEGQNDAVSLCLAAQEDAGLDIVCDGEQRRRHYIWGFIEQLGSVDFDNPMQKKSRGQRYSQETAAPRILEKWNWTKPILLDDLRFVKSRTNKTVKVTLPGPMTVADSVYDDASGRSDAEFADAYAKLLNKEARALSDAGADIIQLDEPCFNIYTDEVKDWGMEMIEKSFDGVSAKRAIHICYGYGTEVVLKWKNSNTDWSHYSVTLPLIADSSIDQVSIEAAAAGINLGVLDCLEGKDVMVGVIDVGTEEVESAQTVADRIREAMKHVSAENLIACTDCGMVPRSRRSAGEKMNALSEGAALVNQELGA
ncbi:MAG: 2-hydroxypropyl-CoM lyase [Alphaproteobacteria bacterium MarineAlpha11_Bin1]|nr:MAG: 2-hydroxypropyl-CoM lyase [Alphaproteobacteria bacterium MarineAlpha11_Bin1]